MLHRVWTAPIIILASIAAVIALVGWSGLVGFSIMLLAIPVTRALGKYQMKLGKARMCASDHRVGI